MPTYVVHLRMPRWSEGIHCLTVKTHAYLRQLETAAEDAESAAIISGERTTRAAAYVRAGLAFEALGLLDDAMSRGYQRALQLEPENTTFAQYVESVRSKIFVQYGARAARRATPRALTVAAAKKARKDKNCGVWSRRAVR